MENLKNNFSTLNNAIDSFIEQNDRIFNTLKTDFDFLKNIDEGRMIVLEGRMIVLGGSSGLGKTAFVLQLLLELVKNNQNSSNSVIGIYCSAEMMKEELIARLLVNQEVVKDLTIENVRKFFSSQLHTKNIAESNRKKAKEILGHLPFYFLNAKDFNLNNISHLLKTIREKNPNKRIFLAIDYLQLLLLDNNALQETNRAIKELKDTLIETQTNAIVISALNRDSMKNDIVDMSAYKDSSMIEYTSDIAMLFTFKRKGKNNKTFYSLKNNGDCKGKIELYLKCVKNRIGPTFLEKLEFDKTKQRFKKIDEKNENKKRIETVLSNLSNENIYNDEDIIITNQDWKSSLEDFVNS